MSAGDAIAAGQRLAWSYRTKGTFLTGSPVIVDGVVYAGTRDENGDGNSAVHAVSLATGKKLWSYSVPSSVHGSVAVSDGLVYVPTLRGSLFAVDARTGKLKWRNDPEPAPEGNNQRTYGYYGVTVADGKVLFPYQTRFGEAAAGLLLALDAKTGQRMWASPMAGNTMSDGTPAVADGRVYVGNQDGSVVIAYDLKTGAKLWTGNRHARRLAGRRPVRGRRQGLHRLEQRHRRPGRCDRCCAVVYTSSHPSLVSSGATPSAAAIKGNTVYMSFPSGAVDGVERDDRCGDLGPTAAGFAVPGWLLHLAGAVRDDSVRRRKQWRLLRAGCADRPAAVVAGHRHLGVGGSRGQRQHRGHGCVRRQPVRVHSGWPGAKPWPLVSGKVTNKTTGAAAANGTVWSSRTVRQSAVTTTDAAGNYQVGLSKGAGTYTVQVAQLGYATAARDVEAAESGTYRADLDVSPVSVDASIGKRLPSGLVEGGSVTS